MPLRRDIFSSVCLGLMLFSVAGFRAQAQEGSNRYSESMIQTRRIRVAKMANEWKGKRVSLERYDGQRIEGLMLRVYDAKFILERKNSERVEVPVDDTASVTLRPGTSDFLLGGLMGLGFGAVTAGVVQLGVESKSNASTIGGLGGFLLGSILGIRLLHRDTVVYLDPLPMLR